MTQHRTVKRLVVVAALLVWVVGCGSSGSTTAEPRAAEGLSRADGSAGGGSSAGAGTGGGQMDQHVRLITAMRDYQLPAQPVPPARHADPQVDAFLQKMMAVAARQGLMFDGRRAAEGIVIVGRNGQSGKPILIGVSVFNKAGRVDVSGYDTIGRAGF